MSRPREMRPPEGAAEAGRAEEAMEILRALTDPRAFPVSGVEVIETHISWVFLAGDRVYKVKKPVDLGFVDFTTLERRRVSCEEEVRPSLLERLSGETRLYLTAIQTALYEFAAQDNVVLLGRGGQWLLRGVPHVIRVRVLAPFDERVRRISEQLSARTQPVSPPAVAEMVRRDDAAKAGRARYLYEIDLDDPRLYTLVINTEVMPVEAAVAVLEQLARRPELAATPESAQLVADQALRSRVEAALAAHEATRRVRYVVEARAGTVTLEAAGSLEEGARVARSVRGVTRVETRVFEIPPVPPIVA